MLFLINWSGFNFFLFQTTQIEMHTQMMCAGRLLPPTLQEFGFQPTFLPYFRKHIKPDDMVDFVIHCQQLEVLKLQGCSQFSENQLYKMWINLPSLVYIDGLYTTPLLASTALVILQNLKRLEYFFIEPKLREFERVDWERMGVLFSVYFGPFVTSFTSSNDLDREEIEIEE